MSDETLDPNALDTDPESDIPIPVQPFIEVLTIHGSRCWIRKSTITGVDEVRASEWEEVGDRTRKPSALVHALGGRTWKIAGEAEDFIRELGQAEL